MGINIQSMYVLSPMEVIYSLDGKENNTIVLIDFIKGCIYDIQGKQIDNIELKNKIIEIVEQKKKIVLNPALPLESIEFALKKENYNVRN